MRLVYLHQVHGFRLSYQSKPIAIWTCIEVQLGVICACMPTLPPLFRRWRHQRWHVRSEQSKHPTRYQSGWYGFSPPFSADARSWSNAAVEKEAMVDGDDLELQVACTRVSTNLGRDNENKNDLQDRIEVLNYVVKNE